MTLSEEEISFIKKRESRAKYWPLLGLGFLAVLVAYASWLWFSIPFMANPWWVIASMENNTLAPSTMSVMALMLPIVVDALLLFMFAVVALWFLPFQSEKKLIKMIRKLEAVSAEHP